MVRSHLANNLQIGISEMMLLACFILLFKSSSLLLLNLTDYSEGLREPITLEKTYKPLSVPINEKEGEPIYENNSISDSKENYPLPLDSHQITDSSYIYPTLNTFTEDAYTNELIVFYDLDACDVSNHTSSQFPPAYYPSACVNINASNFWYSQSGNTYHSCPGHNLILPQGAESSMDAMCWGASHQTYFDPSGAYLHDYYNFSFTANTSSIGRIASLSFYARGPFTNAFRTPSKLGVRVYKNGSIIYEETDVPMNRSPWQLFEFDFSTDTDFQLSGTSDSYEVRIQGYDPQLPGGFTTLLEIDQIRLYASCSMVMADPCTDATGIDSDSDGVNDVCDLDDDNDGIPDVDECYFTSLVVDPVPDGLEDGNYPVGYWDAEYYRGFFGIQGSTFNNSTFDNNEFNFIGTPTFLGEAFFGVNAQTFSDSRSFTNTQSPTSIGVAPTGYVGTNWSPINANPFYQIHFNRTMDTDGTLDFNGNYDDVLELFVNNTRVLFVADCCGAIPSGNFSVPFNAGDIVQIRYTNLGDIGGYNFSFTQNYTCDADVDNDGIPNGLDLDSDNDGIFDLDEAGHTAADANDDGRIDGADTGSGVNGLYDGIETSSESGIINYTISDSEVTPDGNYDPYELDSDGDGCFDAEEAGVLDPENDGTAGAGIPSVDTIGLVTTITYTDPINANWQNPAIGVCLMEVCDDGIDNNMDGLTDCEDCAVCNTNAPTLLGVPADVTLECTASIPSGVGSVSATDPDLCAAAPTVTYTESIVYHSSRDWKDDIGCSILYSISNISYDDKGTTSETDDTFDAILTVIGRNAGIGWSTVVNGTPVSGLYQTNQQLLSISVPIGGIVSFNIIDNGNTACQQMASIDVGLYK